MKKILKCMISFCLITTIVFTTSCNDDKKIIINKDNNKSGASKNNKTNAISSSKHYEITEKKQITPIISSATDCINIVGLNKENKSFWNKIDNCRIDIDYKNEKIQKDNFRMAKLISEIYSGIWNDEIEFEYDRLLDYLSDDDKDYLKEQKKKYNNYVSYTKDIYYRLFELQKEDDNMVSNKSYDGSYRQAMILKKRYAIELKEYYYLAKGDISFKYDEGDDKDNNKKDSTTKNNKKRYRYNLENDLNLVSNKMFKDMTKDHYYNRYREFSIYFKKAKKDKKQALKIAKNILKYWKKQVEDFHDRIEKIDNDEVKSIVEKQYVTWKDYNSATNKLQENVVTKLDKYKATLKGEKDYDLMMLEAYRSKLYAMELWQYNYLLTGKMEF